MIGIISPAKNMQEVYRDDLELSVPVYIEETKEIYKELEKLEPWEIQTLMKVNEKIATQAFLDFQNLKKKKKGSAAILSYDGLVFKNIKAEELSTKQLIYADQHVRILSGFYGVLKPLDEIRPYRLEMACPLKICGDNLYKFWNRRLADEIFQSGQTIINLASEEYAKAVRKYAEPFDRWIDVEFLTMRNGKLRTIVAWAKMARGQMIRYMIEHQIDDPERLKSFEFQGFEYEESLSSENKFVFVSY